MSALTAVPRAPYALEPTSFPFPALAMLAGRAPLGGPREVALACLLVGRLVADAPIEVLSAEQKQSRARGAKHWLGAAAIPHGVRAALSRLAEAAATADRSAMKGGLESVMAVTASQLDSAALLELGRLAQVIAK